MKSHLEFAKKHVGDSANMEKMFSGLMRPKLAFWPWHKVLHSAETQHLWNTIPTANHEGGIIMLRGFKNLNMSEWPSQTPNKAQSDRETVARGRRMGKNIKIQMNENEVDFSSGFLLYKMWNSSVGVNTSRP